MDVQVPPWEVIVLLLAGFGGIMDQLRRIRASSAVRSREIEGRMSVVETLVVDHTGNGPLLLAHVATREDVEHKLAQSGAGLVEEVRKVGSDLGERLDKQERRSDERMRVVRDSFDGFGREIGGIKERLAGMGNGRHYGEQQE